MKKTEVKMEKMKETKLVGTEFIPTRGKTFEGTVTKKFQKRVVIEFERTVYVKKYERYAKSKTKIHARVMPEMENVISVGDYIRVQECRPLSKIIHFIVLKKLKDAKENTDAEKLTRESEK
ncbi:MAG: 30S ribosomal protein S17 [Nanoarchaeota archaeon]|nr:30S ribosomal protein S17 [Nanoarchaeota archaeon]